MNFLIKKTIFFFTFSIFASLVIYNVIPLKQNVHISVLSKPELLFLNKELVNLGLENRIKIKYFESYYNKENANPIEKNILNRLSSKSDEDQNVEDLNASEISQLIEIFFYKNIIIYGDIILNRIKNEKNITEREKKFFENITVTKRLKINPEDGSARTSIISFIYSNKEIYSEKEILLLSKKIEDSLSNFYFELYNQLLSNKFSEVEKYIFLVNDRSYEQDIKSLIATQASNQINLNKLINGKKNLNEDFLSLKETYNSSLNKSYFIKSINYKTIQNYYSKSFLKMKYFYPLLIFFNLLFYGIFIIFFRNGWNFFIKKYLEKF